MQHNHAVQPKKFPKEFKNTSGTVMVLSDSQLPPCFGNVETQLPCSPSQLLQTDAALETLRSLDAHEKEVAKEVGDL